MSAYRVSLEESLLKQYICLLIFLIESVKSVIVESIGFVKQSCKHIICALELPMSCWMQVNMTLRPGQPTLGILARCTIQEVKLELFIIRSQYHDQHDQNSHILVVPAVVVTLCQSRVSIQEVWCEQDTCTRVFTYAVKKCLKSNLSPTSHTHLGLTMPPSYSLSFKFTEGDYWTWHAGQLCPYLVLHVLG